MRSVMLGKARGHKRIGHSMTQIQRATLDLGIEIEEGFQACAKLLLDFFLTAFEDVHRHVSLPSIGEFDWSLADLGNLVGRQESHAVNQCQICHTRFYDFPGWLEKSPG